MSISTAVDLSAVARTVGIKTEFKNLRASNVLYLPQRLAIIGQGASSVTYSTDKQQFTSAQAIASVYGHGSALHLAALQVLPDVGSIPVTIYPLADDPSGVAATADITPSGASTGVGSFIVMIGGQRSEGFSIGNGDTVEQINTKITTSINASLNVPMTASDNTTNVGLTCKWKGSSGNSITLKIVETSNNSTGISFAVTQPNAGLVNPSVQPALDQIGNVWETMILNCLEISDTAALEAFKNEGELRWGALVRKPFLVFTGNTSSSVADATAVSSSRASDRVNGQLVAPGSDELPFVVAAKTLSKIIVTANNNPARDYACQEVLNVKPGVDSAQWNYADRDQAIKSGSSTIEVKDNVINISDTVTFYHPDGDPTPAYRYVCDVVKLTNIIFNLDVLFNNTEWAGAPLVPDGQPTVNPEAKKPSQAVASISSLLDNLELLALISDADTAKKNTSAAISAQNPKRLDVQTVVQLAGNANIISVDLDFGFYFGRIN